MGNGRRKTEKRKSFQENVPGIQDRGLVLCRQGCVEAEERTVRKAAVRLALSRAETIGFPSHAPNQNGL
jgi:hypothetical protein